MHRSRVPFGDTIAAGISAATARGEKLKVSPPGQLSTLDHALTLAIAWPVPLRYRGASNFCAIINCFNEGRSP